MKISTIRSHRYSAKNSDNNNVNDWISKYPSLCQFVNFVKHDPCLDTRVGLVLPIRFNALRIHR